MICGGNQLRWWLGLLIFLCSFSWAFGGVVGEQHFGDEVRQRNIFPLPRIDHTGKQSDAQF